MEIADALREWHDFYVLVGTASATLIGLMFVAASIAAGFFSKEQQAGLQAFITPTVVHFGSILVASLIMAAPAQSRLSLGLLLLAGGLGGLGYSAIVWLRMRRRGLSATIDLADRLWYALTPIAGYLLVIAAAILVLTHRPLGLELLAVATVLLLLMGIRNAWDMTAWMVVRPRDK